MHIDYAEPDEPRDTLLKNSKPVPLYSVVPLNNDNEMPLTIKLTITVVIPKNDSATNDAFDADNAYDITTSITPHDNDNNCL